MNLNQKDWLKNNEEDNESVIVDVRTQEEYNLGYIKNSILIDVNQPNLFMESISNLDKRNSYYVYCRTGVRSEMACSLMNQSGLTAYNLIGGFVEWKGEIEKK
ncbi:MAG: rhodanese-like domain-containing protein [Flavobacteriaceae bacterium]|tara:strand:- start:1588 stop:1896 length:309 start_codon:yes stop_codon:yes gene_type:complete